MLACRWRVEDSPGKIEEKVQGTVDTNLADRTYY